MHNIYAIQCSKTQQKMQTQPIHNVISNGICLLNEVLHIGWVSRCMALARVSCTHKHTRARQLEKDKNERGKGRKDPIIQYFHHYLSTSTPKKMSFSPLSQNVGVYIFLRIFQDNNEIEGAEKNTGCIHCILDFMHISLSIIYMILKLYPCYSPSLMTMKERKHSTHKVQRLENAPVYYSFMVYISFVSFY